MEFHSIGTPSLWIGFIVLVCFLLAIDLVMFRDAVKTAGLEGKILVKDLIELVHEAL